MNTMDASLLQKAFLSGAKCLESKKEWINELNVFPVPDGDTGTNMTMTMMSAAKDVAMIEHPTMQTLAKAISSGSLKGARGNSGVILSQLFRGFSKVIEEVGELDTILLAKAFERGTETAYKAVMKPKEGTILTVAKGMSDKAMEISETVTDIIEFLEEVITYGEIVLSKTPDMLPVLKEAGVVDSGGQGLMEVMKGGLRALKGEEVSFGFEQEPSMPAIQPLVSSEQSLIHFGYCTEFIVYIDQAFDEKKEQEFKNYLESIGDSIVVVSDDDLIKVHVHTNNPGNALERALTYGNLSRIKIDNMREEHEEKLIKNASKIAENIVAKVAVERVPYGFVSICAGEGIAGIFEGLGADYVIEGGQTMNPSTEDILKAVEQVHADTVFILPNNKNIILAAQQAKTLCEDKHLIVIPSKTIPQGITAMIAFSPELEADDNAKNMTAEFERVKTGQITYAVRNTTIDGMEIREGNLMGIGDHGILTVGTSIEQVSLDTLSSMVDEDTELISIYYGEDVSDVDADAFHMKVTKQFPSCEIELHAGGQPIYYYLLSVE